MILEVVIKSLGIWLLIVIAAIINGVTREKILIPLMGSSFSLPLSGFILSLLVIVIAYITIPYIGKLKTGAYIFIGLLWVTLTLSFEYLFGHYVVGKPCREINQVFNILKGDLFIVVLIVTGLSPWTVAKLKGQV